MDSREFKQMQKLEKGHSNRCSNCMKPKKEGCKSSSCERLVQHCACEMGRR